MCRVVGFVGAVGGVGVTSLVFELGERLSADSRVCVIDLKCNRNSLSLKYGAENKVVDFKQYIIGSANEREVLNRAKENLCYVKTNDLMFEYFSHVEMIKCFIKNISLYFDYVIVDCDDSHLFLFDDCFSEVVVVGDNSCESVFNMRRLKRKFCFYNKNIDLKILINKAKMYAEKRRTVLCKNEIESILKESVFYVIPYFYKNNYFNYKNITKYQSDIIKSFCNSFITNMISDDKHLKLYHGVLGFVRRLIYEKYE